MIPVILGSDYATRIRSRLGVNDSHLTVAEIDEVLPEIEAMIMEKIPDYASKTGNLKIYLDSAVVCKAASVLCTVLKKKFPVREQGPGGSFETQLNWDEEALKHEQNYSMFMSKLKPPTVYPHFKVMR